MKAKEKLFKKFFQGWGVNFVLKYKLNPSPANPRRPLVGWTAIFYTIFIFCPFRSIRGPHTDQSTTIGTPLQIQIKSNIKII